jgi:hypothetical protein
MLFGKAKLFRGLPTNLQDIIGWDKYEYKQTREKEVVARKLMPIVGHEVV